jgi:hypothetical protein
MNESSWMMGGGRMSVELDEAKGQAVGSHIRLSGRVFGVSLYLDEVVTRRDPPTNKVWETVGTPRLLVIGAYSIGVQIPRPYSVDAPAPSCLPRCGTGTRFAFADVDRRIPSI